jgi:hypothetical protein
VIVGSSKHNVGGCSSQQCWCVYMYMCSSVLAALLYGYLFAASFCPLLGRPFFRLYFAAGSASPRLLPLLPLVQCEPSCIRCAFAAM